MLDTNFREFFIYYGSEKNYPNQKFSLSFFLEYLWGVPFLTDLARGNQKVHECNGKLLALPLCPKKQKYCSQQE